MTSAQVKPQEKIIAAKAMYEATAELAAMAFAAGDYERHEELTSVASTFLADMRSKKNG